MEGFSKNMIELGETGQQRTPTLVNHWLGIWVKFQRNFS
jgi:hypothetical protein